MKPRFSKSRPSPPPRNMSASWLPRPVAEDPRGTTRRPRRYADVARGGQCPEPSPASSRRRASLRGAVRAMQISKRLSLSFSSKASRSADNLDALAQHEELDAASPPQSPTTPPGDDPRDRDAVDFGRALVGDVPATERKSRSLVLMWLRTSQRTVSALGAAARFGRTISWGSGRGRDSVSGWRHGSRDIHAAPRGEAATHPRRRHRQHSNAAKIPQKRCSNGRDRVANSAKVSRNVRPRSSRRPQVLRCLARRADALRREAESRAEPEAPVASPAHRFAPRLAGEEARAVESASWRLRRARADFFVLGNARYLRRAFGEPWNSSSSKDGAASSSATDGKPQRRASTASLLDGAAAGDASRDAALASAELFAWLERLEASATAAYAPACQIHPFRLIFFAVLDCAVTDAATSPRGHREATATPLRRRREAAARPLRRLREATATPRRRHRNADAATPRRRHRDAATPPPQPRRRDAAAARPPRRRYDAAARLPRRRYDAAARLPRRRHDAAERPPQRRDAAAANRLGHPRS